MLLIKRQEYILNSKAAKGYYQKYYLNLALNSKDPTTIISALKSISDGGRKFKNRPKAGGFLNNVKQKITEPWTSIGTMLGQPVIDSYTFFLKNTKQGDIVAAEAKLPTGEGKVIDVIVWGRITEIISSNDFLPNEASKELTEKDINIQDTILPLTKNDSICMVTNLGYTKNQVGEKMILLPINCNARWNNKISS